MHNINYNNDYAKFNGIAKGDNVTVKFIPGVFKLGTGVVEPEAVVGVVEGIREVMGVSYLQVKVAGKILEFTPHNILSVAKNVAKR